MGDIVQFVPRAEKDADANLMEFIRLTREELTSFGGDGSWVDDRWQDGATTVVFATKTTPLDPYSFTPMAEPFKQFAKAYVRYSWSHRPVRNLSFMILALRCVEAGLLAACGRADVGLLGIAVMDVCANKCAEFCGTKQIQYSVGRHIQLIFDFLRGKRLVRFLPPWKSPFKKPAILTEGVGEAGAAYRASKLPSTQVMLQVADLFAVADDVESRYFSSLIIILMATPSRISEVLRLPVDCVQWELDEAGQSQMYLRWRAAKGKGGMKKWVVPVMHEVVQEAVKRLLEIGQPARDAAKFASANPGQFMYHSGCLRETKGVDETPLTPEQFCAAVNVRYPRHKPRAGLRAWHEVRLDSRLKALVNQGRTSYRDLAEHVLSDCSDAYWPYIDGERTVLAWDSLCLHRINEFHMEFEAKQFSWRLPNANEVNSRLGKAGRPSLFERRGLKGEGGRAIKLTTHQLRHWLSTMSERAGMDDFTLAQWAGRARVSDNRHYDHRSPQERLAGARELLSLRHISPLERFSQRAPVTYQELGVDRLGTAKATLYGMCVHDYAMAPCQKQRECMTCKEHVCIKGDHVTLERIRLLELQTETLLARARRAHSEGDFGADRWVDSHKWKLAHVRAMRLALEHPEVSSGAILRIPEGHDPSPVRRALLDLGLIEHPASESVDTLNITMHGSTDKCPGL
jgi:hypothetical protein